MPACPTDVVLGSVKVYFSSSPLSRDKWKVPNRSDDDDDDDDDGLEVYGTYPQGLIGQCEIPYRN